MAEYSCLIVEDSEVMRQLLVAAMADIEHLQTVEADDGVAALKRLSNQKFDIVITDINMPIMDGLKLIRRIRVDPVHKDVPIVVITTEASSEDRQRALSLGATTYITKPIQEPLVVTQVKELLGIQD